MARTQRFIACAGISLRFFFLASPTPLSSRHIFAFSIGCSGRGGAVGEGASEKNNSAPFSGRQQTCFHMIVEQGHKLLKGPIVFSNEVYFRNTF